jgi:hypothetical protein
MKQDYLDLTGAGGKKCWKYLTDLGMRAYARQTRIYGADVEDAAKADPEFTKTCLHGRGLGHFFKNRKKEREWRKMENPEFIEYIKTKTKYFGRNPNFVLNRDQGLYREAYRRGLIEEVFPKKHKPLAPTDQPNFEI